MQSGEFFMFEFIEKNKIFIGVFLCFAIFTFFTMDQEEKEIIISEVSETKTELKQQEYIQEKTVIFVHIAGNVGEPGLYEIEEGSRLNDLIVPAKIKDMEILDKYFNRAKLLSDGEKIYIPFPEEINKENDEVVLFASEEDQSKININTAGLSDLITLPGIGDTKARDIIDFREKNGKFKIIDDIMMVKGIGIATFERIKELIKT
ncbi:MAG: ComEA family DNA-binding protein [Clostridia bacterium]|jgi:competence protein ComEA|nr:ComEA family DNA-binding protein [Clostridia bacterium]